MKTTLRLCVACVLLTLAARAMPQTATTASAPASAPASGPADVLATALEAKLSPASEKRYPKLAPACEAFAKDWNEHEAQDAQEANRTPLKIALRVILLPLEQPELCRYLNVWYRSRTVQRWDGGRYPAGSFDNVTPEPPRKQAYVIFSDGAQRFVVRFNLDVSAEEGASKEEFWADSDFAPLAGAVRTGAALAVVQDALDALKQKKDFTPFAAGDFKWSLGVPAGWSFIELQADGEGKAYQPLETQLAKPAARAAVIPVRLREEGGKETNLQIHLDRKTDGPLYTGWRIAKVEKTAEP